MGGKASNDEKKKSSGKEIVKYKKYKENSFSPFGKNGIKKWNRVSERIEAKYTDEKKKKKEKKDNTKKMIYKYLL